jgi:predicted ATPase
MSYQKLRSIEVKGYKSIRDQIIPLTDMNVLIGQNGAGKTNFISLFKLLRNIINGRLKNISLKSGAENLLYYGNKETQIISIYLDFDPNYYWVHLQPASNKDTLIIESEVSGFKDNDHTHPFWDQITSSEEESTLVIKAKNIPTAKYVLGVLNEWRVYHFQDTSESAGIMKYASMADNKFLFEDASNLAPFLYLLKYTREEFYERIVKTVQLVIPFFNDFLLEPNPFNSATIRLEWSDIYSDKTFSANELSDGSLRFICMATLLLQPDLPKVILLDEPELGLHPSAITILSGLLKKASNRSQVIVSTQSVSLVNEFEAEDIIVVEKDKAETVFKRLDPAGLEVWLNDYSLGELWDKNILGGKP